MSMRIDLKDNRDFVDLTIDFIQNRRYFYFIFTFFTVILSIYFLHFNNYYTFRLVIDVAPESSYVPIMNRVNLLRKKPVKILESPFEDFKTYKELSSEVCMLVISVAANDQFYKEIASDYIIKYGHQKTEKMIESVAKGLKNTMEYKKSPFCTEINISGDESSILFLEDKYISYLSQMVSREIFSTVEILRKEKISTIKSILSSVGSSELLEGNLTLLKNMPNLESSFDKIHYSKSEIKNGTGKTFVLLLSLFVSFIFYVFLIMAYDFNKQIKARKDSD
jgi:hypothetical protein